MRPARQTSSRRKNGACALFAALALLAAARQAASEETLLFTTEPYAPFSMQEQGKPPSGIAVDTVRKIMAEVKIPYTIEVMPWARAMALAETEPTACVFSTAQTPDREPNFKWVSPLIVGHNILVKHRDAGVAARTLEEARAFTIGTHRGDFTETLLQNLHFSKIDISATFDVTLGKLLRNRIDLMPMSQTVYLQLKNQGVAIDEVAHLTTQRFGIACNLAVSSQVIASMQTSLEHLRADGGLAAIYREYGLDLPH